MVKSWTKFTLQKQTRKEAGNRYSGQSYLGGWQFVKNLKPAEAIEMIQENKIPENHRIYARSAVFPVKRHKCSIGNGWDYCPVEGCPNSAKGAST